MKKVRNFKNKKGFFRVNPRNDLQMVKEGLRPPRLTLDRTIFRKTDAERYLLKQLKKNCQGMIGRTIKYRAI